MSRLGFHRKIVATSSVSIFLTIIVLVNLYYNTERMKKFQLSSEESQATISKLAYLNTLMVDMETGVRGFMLSGEPAYLEPYNKAETEFEEYIRTIEKNPTHKNRIENVHALKKKWIEEAAMGEMMARRKLNAKRITLEDFTNIFKASKGKGFTDQIRDEVKKGIALEENKIISLRKETLHIARLVVIASAIVVLVVLISFSSIIYISKLIFKQMTFLSNDLEGVAELVKTTSSSLALISENLNQSTREQSKSLGSTSSSLYQISQMAKSSSENAQSSTEAVLSCNTLAEHGKKSVGEMIISVNEISDGNSLFISEIEENNKKMEEIVKIILEIGDKTKVINDIVFQTRILSFNASVESARAGEHGKGFAIVADEIGKLAAVSGEAAKEISDLLLRSEREVKLIVNDTSKRIMVLVEDGKNRIGKSKTVIDKTETVIDSVVVEVAKIARMLSGISMAIAEQDSSIDGINSDMLELNNVAEGTSKISLETQNSAEILLEQSQKLSFSIINLKNSIHGKAI